VFKAKAPGHCWWNELETSDEPGATAFYTALFGWKAEQAMPMGDKGDYRFVESGGAQIGAINPWLADYMTVGWLPYFGVADIDAAKAAAEASGGTVTHDVHEVPGGDFIFTATDPAGAPVGFVGPKGA
jgi:predicted enzyme related to lactoylglutathione lyase